MKFSDMSAADLVHADILTRLIYHVGVGKRKEQRRVDEGTWGLSKRTH